MYPLVGPGGRKSRVHGRSTLSPRSWNTAWRSADMVASSYGIGQRGCHNYQGVSTVSWAVLCLIFLCSRLFPMVFRLPPVYDVTQMRCTYSLLLLLQRSSGTIRRSKGRCAAERQGIYTVS